MTAADRVQVGQVAFVAGGLAAAQAIIAIAVSLLPNPEGPAGGVFYAAMFVLPALLLALALRSPRRSWNVVAGWSALALAVAYLAIFVGNWSGESLAQSIFAVIVIAPTVSVDLLIYWAVIVRGSRERSSRPRTA